MTTASSKKRLEDWKCPGCNFYPVFGSKPKCTGCGTENPALTKKEEPKEEEEYEVVKEEEECQKCPLCKQKLAHN